MANFYAQRKEKAGYRRDVAKRKVRRKWDDLLEWFKVLADLLEEWLFRIFDDLLQKWYLGFPVWFIRNDDHERGF